MSDRPVVFYVSGHGFGHATRSCEVMKELHKLVPNIHFHVRSNAPEWLFSSNMSAPYDYTFIEIDIGVVQSTVFRVDKLRTLEECRSLLRRRPRMVRKEVEFIKGRKIELVISDIAPIAFEIAARAKVRSIGMGNFSWDWIYEPFLREYPQFKKVINTIRNLQAKADLLLRLPLAGKMSSFKRQKAVPMIGRRSDLGKAAARAQLGLGAADKRPLVLFSFGGLGGSEFVAKGAAGCPECLFAVLTDSPLPATGNLIRLPRHTELRHEDLVKAADMVMSKPGYGIVTECVANRTPLMFTSRDDFAEYDVLVQGVKKLMPWYFMPREDLLEGNWRQHVLEFLKFTRRPGANRAAGLKSMGGKWKTVPVNGASVIAGNIGRILDKGGRRVGK